MLKCFSVVNDGHLIMEEDPTSQKFEKLRGLALPIGEHAITGSGPLGIRGLREIRDLDVIVTEDLWELLESRYGSSDWDGIIHYGLDIEFIHQQNFIDEPEGIPSIQEQIKKSEMIQGLPFVRLEHLILFKQRRLSSAKDFRDLQLIKRFLEDQAEL